MPDVYTLIALSEKNHERHPKYRPHIAKLPHSTKGGTQTRPILLDRGDGDETACGDFDVLCRDVVPTLENLGIALPYSESRPPIRIACWLESHYFDKKPNWSDTNATDSVSDDSVSDAAGGIFGVLAQALTIAAAETKEQSNPHTVMIDFCATYDVPPKVIEGLVRAEWPQAANDWRIANGKTGIYSSEVDQRTTSSKLELAIFSGGLYSHETVAIIKSLSGSENHEVGAAWVADYLAKTYGYTPAQIDAVDLTSLLPLLRRAKNNQQSGRNKAVAVGMPDRKPAGRKPTKLNDEWARYAKPRRERELPMTWEAIYVDWNKKNPDDQKAGPDAMRLAYERRFGSGKQPTKPT